MTASQVQVPFEEKCEEKKSVSHAELDQVAPPAGFVRGALGLTTSLYGVVKNYSPYLKQGLETVEQQIPEPWIGHLSCVSEPVINNLDTQIEQLRLQVNERVICPVNATVNHAGEKVGQWKSLRGDLTKKAVERLERGMTQVRHFSATRGKEMIHVDLIAYSEAVVGNASSAAKQTVEPLQQNLAAAVLNLNNTLQSLQAATAQQMEKAATLSAAGRADLQLKLKSAVVAARELSRTSILYVHDRYQTIETAFPQTSASLKFIVSSPSVFVNHLTENQVITNAQKLLSAVRDVVFGGPDAGHVQEMQEEDVAEDAVTEIKMAAQTAQ